MSDDAEAGRPIPVLDLFAGIGGFTLAFESVMADTGCAAIRRRPDGGCADEPKEARARERLQRERRGDAVSYSGAPEGCLGDTDAAGLAHRAGEHRRVGASSEERLSRDGRPSAFRTIGFAEIDPYATAVLSRHWPRAVQFGAVQNVTRDSVIEQCGVLPAVVTGGFPCQPHSLAGKRGASADERDLWDECARVLRELRPKYALFENVRGLLTSESGLFLNRVLSDLAELRYACQWQVVSAEDIGAPHRRERIWLLCVDELAYSNRGRRGEEGPAENRRRPNGSGTDTAELADSDEGRPLESLDTGERSRTVADADRDGRHEGNVTSELRTTRTVEPSGDSRSANPSEGEERPEGRWPAAYGLWPSRPGEPQHGWEPPRVVGDTNGRRCEQRDPLERGLPIPDETGRQTQSIVGRDTNGIPDQSHADPAPLQESTVNRVPRLKALGNAIVPGVAVIFARAIYRLENR